MNPVAPVHLAEAQSDTGVATTQGLICPARTDAMMELTNSLHPLLVLVHNVHPHWRGALHVPTSPLKVCSCSTACIHRRWIGNIVGRLVILVFPSHLVRATGLDNFRLRSWRMDVSLASLYWRLKNGLRLEGWQPQGRVLVPSTWFANVFQPKRHLRFGLMGNSPIRRVLSTTWGWPGVTQHPESSSQTQCCFPPACEHPAGGFTRVPDIGRFTLWKQHNMLRIILWRGHKES